MKAVIFDMDGVLVDNMDYHLRAWRHFYQKYSLPFSEQEFKRKEFGRTNAQTLRDLFGQNLSRNQIKKFVEEKEGLYRRIYARAIRPVRGLRSFLQILEKNKIRIALATAAPRENVRFVLRHTGTRKYFQIIIDDTDIIRGKPNPEIFLKAAKKLKVRPNSCIVIEDSLGGIKAAKRAKMKVVAVLTTHSRSELAKADSFIKDFSAKYRNKILELLK